jgi:hypothetical protein
MAESKTKVTNVKVEDFIAAIDNDTRRADALTLLQLLGKHKGGTRKDPEGLAETRKTWPVTGS